MTQKDAILTHLQEGKRISPLSALKEFSCMRLASRIYDLRSEGYPIETVRVHGKGCHWAEYKLAQSNDNYPAPVK